MLVSRSKYVGSIYVPVIIPIVSTFDMAVVKGISGGNLISIPQSASIGSTRENSMRPIESSPTMF